MLLKYNVKSCFLVSLGLGVTLVMGQPKISEVVLGLASRHEAESGPFSSYCGLILVVFAFIISFFLCYLG